MRVFFSQAVHVPSYVAHKGVQSWIFKSFCDATATTDATATHKIAIFK